MKKYLNHLAFFCSLAAVVALTIFITPLFHGMGDALAVSNPEPAHEETSHAPVVTPAHSAVNTGKTAHGHADDHDDADVTLPADLQAYLESKRVQADQIPMTRHANGDITLHAGEQFNTVVMAVIDETGRVRTTERQIQPLGVVEIGR